jgi:hypothetical protein
MSGHALLPERRSFLACMNAGAASLIAMGGVASAQQSEAPAAPWEPARHPQDAWLDEPSSKHRVVFDSTEFDSAGESLAFAANSFHVNQDDYGLRDNDLAVLIVLRHGATVFGYNDAMWAKYGEVLAGLSKAVDPKTKQTPKLNLYLASGYGDLLPSRGHTLAEVAKHGAQFAICAMATHAFSGMIAKKSGGKANEVFAELNSNLIANARMVPAGVVAVTRAQEYGYSVVSC